MKVTQAQLASFLLGGVVIGFSVNVLSGMWPGNEFVFATLGALAAILTFLLPTDGFLRRQRYGRALGVRTLAVCLVVGYPFVVAWQTSRDASRGFDLIATVVPTVCLWLASSLLLYVSSSISFSRVALGAASELGGMVFLLAGFWNVLARGQPMWGQAVYLLLGVTFVLVGVSLLLRDAARVDRRTGAAALLSGGTALILLGWRDIGPWGLLTGLAFWLLGVEVVLNTGRRLSDVAILLVGVVSILLGGVSLIGGGGYLFGIGFALLGVVALLVRAELRRDQLAVALYPSRSRALAFLLGGAALVLLGPAFLLTDVGLALPATAALLGGLALLMIGAGLLVPSSALRRAARRAQVWLLSGAEEGRPK